MAIDNDKLMDFLHRFVGDLEAALAAGSVVIGNRLGLYRALAQGPRRPASSPSAPASPPALPHRVAARPGRGRLRELRPGERETFSLTEEQAFCLADPNGPDLSGAFLVALGYLRAERGSPRRSAPARASAGTSTTTTSSSAATRSTGPATSPTWSRAGSRRSTASRRSCGRGAGRRRRLRARVLVGAHGEAFPRSTSSARTTTPSRSSWPARRRPRPGVADRVTLRGGHRADLHRHRLRPGDDVRLPARHGRPGRRRPAGPRGAGAGRHVAAGRAVRAGDAVEENLNPVGRLYYTGSTFLCVPNALSQPGGYALGAQAGEAAIRRGRHRGRLHPVPPGRRDAVQPGLRDPALTMSRSRGRGGAMRALDRTPEGSSSATASARRLRGLRETGEHTVLLSPDLMVDRPSRLWKAQVPLWPPATTGCSRSTRGATARSDRPDRPGLGAYAPCAAGPGRRRGDRRAVMDAAVMVGSQLAMVALPLAAASRAGAAAARHRPFGPRCWPT